MNASLQSTSKNKGAWFLIALILFAALPMLWVSRSLNVSGSNSVMATFWLTGFFTLNLNVAYMLLTAIIARFSRPIVYPAISSGAQPPCDLLYVIRNEPRHVFKNMRESLRNARTERTRLVVISNSTESEAIGGEEAEIQLLQQEFGDPRIVYWRSRHNPTGRKHTAIEHWLREVSTVPYAMICDADTVVPAGAIETLLGIIEHPKQADVAILQAELRVRETKTRFTQYLKFGTELSQRVYMKATQRIFGCSPYFGHGALVRRAAFARLRVPARVLSHDIWDSAFLARRGWKVIYCPEAYTLEEVPASYHETLRRDRRWIEGTLQCWPLLRISGLPLANRFFVFFAIYAYVSQFLLLMWMIVGLFATLLMQPRLPGSSTLAAFGMCGFVLDGGAMYWPVLLVVFLHKLPMCRSLGELGESMRELVFSTILFLNNIVYTPIAIALAPFGKGIWRPMQKGASQPTPTLWKTLCLMAPSLIFGCVLSFIGFRYARGWALSSLPFLLAFVAGPWIAHFTSRPEESVNRTQSSKREVAIAR